MLLLEGLDPDVVAERGLEGTLELDEGVGSGSDPDVNWKGWIRTSIGKNGDWKDVDRKGMRLLEDNSDKVAGSGSDPDSDWKGW